MKLKRKKILKKKRVKIDANDEADEENLVIVTPTTTSAEPRLISFHPEDQNDQGKLAGEDEALVAPGTEVRTSVTSSVKVVVSVPEGVDYNDGDAILVAVSPIGTLLL